MTTLNETLAQYPTRVLGVDISKWNDSYLDDGIEEGFKKPFFVVQKAGDGKWSFYDKAYYGGIEVNRQKFLAQRESLNSFPVVGLYHWIQTESAHSVNAHVDAIIRSFEEGDYDFIALDYESYKNVISRTTAFKLRDIANQLKVKLPHVTLFIYSNSWILKNLVYWLSAEWMNQHIIWAAGGALYNKEATEQVGDDYHIYTVPNLAIEVEQYSADGNRLADELDFGTSETASLDLNVANCTEAEFLQWVGKSLDEPTPEPVEPEVPEPVEPCEGCKYIELIDYLEDEITVAISKAVVTQCDEARQVWSSK